MKAVGAGPHPAMFTETVGSPPVVGQDVVLHGAINTQKTSQVITYKSYNNQDK